MDTFSSSTEASKKWDNKKPKMIVRHVKNVKLCTEIFNTAISFTSYLDWYSQDEKKGYS